jgi:hypothetical protein
MPLAYFIADSYVRTLDMRNLSKLQIHLMHAMKTVAMGDWAREALAQLKRGN